MATTGTTDGKNTNVRPIGRALEVAILPFLGIGGMQLFVAEAPGVSPDKLSPRIKETAKRLSEGIPLHKDVVEWFQNITTELNISNLKTI